MSNNHSNSDEVFVCDEVREHQAALAAWRAKYGETNQMAKLPIQATAAHAATTVNSANERQAYIEAFGRVVCAMQTKYPGVSRQRAIRMAAADSPELHQRYQKSLPLVGPRLGK
jgi:hypothetical protein